MEYILNIVLIASLAKFYMPIGANFFIISSITQVENMCFIIFL